MSLVQLSVRMNIPVNGELSWVELIQTEQTVYWSILLFYSLIRLQWNEFSEEEEINLQEKMKKKDRPNIMSSVGVVSTDS